jgi:hypothetical protein
VADQTRPLHDTYLTPCRATSQPDGAADPGSGQRR